MPCIRIWGCSTYGCHDNLLNASIFGRPARLSACRLHTSSASRSSIVYIPQTGKQGRPCDGVTVSRVPGSDACFLWQRSGRIPWQEASRLFFFSSPRFRGLDLRYQAFISVFFSSLRVATFRHFFFTSVFGVIFLPARSPFASKWMAFERHGVFFFSGVMSRCVGFCSAELAVPRRHHFHAMVTCNDGI